MKSYTKKKKMGQGQKGYQALSKEIELDHSKKS